MLKSLIIYQISSRHDMIHEFESWNFSSSRWFLNSEAEMTPYKPKLF